MYNVSEEYKQQINETRRHTIKAAILPYSHIYEIDITKNLCGEISKYTQCVENSETLGIGSVYQGELIFSVKPSASFPSNLWNARVNMQFGLILESGETEWIPLGAYYIRELEKTAGIYKFKALDRMSELDVETWINSGQSHTFAESMTKITELTGVEFSQTIDEITELAGFPIWQYYSFGEYETCRDILKEMAQFVGGFAFINRDDKIEFKRLDNTTPVAEIPANRRHSLAISGKNLQFGYLQYTSTEGGFFSYIINGYNAKIYFENNGFVGTSEDTINSTLEFIANNLKGIEYAPGTVEYSGNPALDIGDYVTVTGGDASGELILIGSDNWTFRGVQTLTAPFEDTSVSTTETAGRNGKNGSDGFSPEIIEHENTDTSYILKIINKDGSFLTPNLLKNIIIDNFLSETSENAVQNKVITLKLKEFDEMFAEIKKLLEEIKALLESGGTSDLAGSLILDMLGTDENITGIMTVEEE